MAGPPHVQAFKHFLENDDDAIRDYIAFGLYMKAEVDWVAGKEKPPTETEYRHFHQIYLTPRQTSLIKGAADDVLAKYTTDAVNLEQGKFLVHALEQYKSEAAKGHRKFRWMGVPEAALGAVLWTAILIVTIMAERGGIDILEYYKRATAHSETATH
jgi:hypothetical protein